MVTKYSPGDLSGHAEISGRLAAVRDRIAAAEHRFGRLPGSVELLAVSKTKPASVIREAYLLGQKAFGENYLQEALQKMAELAELELEWHFIGPVQSNKTRAIAEHFQWVHSVDRLKVARRLSSQRPEALPPLNVCIEVNVSGEPTKSGLELDALPELAAEVAQLPRLRLRGLMAIPAPCEDFEAQRLPYRRLGNALKALAESGLGLDTLSMGMTADMEAAIAEGATLVRIGTAVFGPRPRKLHQD
jgi:pyridoxal phosphate enzyme (YggS family)